MKTLNPPPSNPGGYLPQSDMASTLASAIDDFNIYWSSSQPNPPEWTRPQVLHDQPWYLGRIKRIDAVNLLRRDGDFLVRDSISNAGEYVLTGQCRGEPMHFEIHRAPSSAPGADLYYFEDEQFRSIVDLIQFYVTHRRQVTAKSRFVLVTPVSNDMPSETSSFAQRNGFQAEIEAAYAPFINKQSQLAATRAQQPSLTQTAILNQAKKRLNGSEHDLSFLASTSNSAIPVSKSFNELPMTHQLKVTNFGTDIRSTPESFVPPVSSRPVPKFSPPKPVPTAFNDLDDYDDLDYDKMEPTTLSNNNRLRSPPAIPPKPANLCIKRHSEIDETTMRVNMGPRKHSVHSLYQTETPFENPEHNAPIVSPSYLDRTQSCTSLIYRQKSTDASLEHRRYPSVKIEPAPLLPSRSRTSLGSLSALTVSPPEPTHDLSSSTSTSTGTSNHDDTYDYDDLKTSPKPKDCDYHDPDYDSTRKAPPMKQPSQETPKPKTFAQLRAATQPARQIRHLLSFLNSVPPTKLSLLITIEDIKIFQLNSGKPTESLRSVFLIENKALRDDILDRNACLQLTVATTLQKSTASKALFKVWVVAAQHLLQKIGNGFAFGAVVSALKTEVSRKPRFLVEADAATVAIYRSLVPIYDEFLNGQMPSPIAGCFLPFIQPLLQLLSKSDYVHTGRIKNMNSEGIDQLEILSNMIHLSRHVLFENMPKLDGSLKLMDQAAAPLGAAINPLSTESLVHCLLLTSSVGNDFKDLERRKIRQLYEQSI